MISCKKCTEDTSTARIKNQHKLIFWFTVPYFSYVYFFINVKEAFAIS